LIPGKPAAASTSSSLVIRIVGRFSSNDAAHRDNSRSVRRSMRCGSHAHSSANNKCTTKEMLKRTPITPINDQVCASTKVWTSRRNVAAAV
jgi:hypothetical protein